MLSTAQLSAVKSDPTTPQISGLGGNTNLTEHTPFSVLDSQSQEGADTGGGIGKIPGDIFQNIKNIPSDYMNAIKGIGDAWGQAGKTIKQSAQNYNIINPADPGSATKNLLNASLDDAGALGKGITHSIAAIINPAFKDIANITSDIGTGAQAKGANAIDQGALGAQHSRVGQIVLGAIASHPDAVRILSDLGNATGGALALTGLNPEDLANLTTGTIDAAKGAIGGTEPTITVGGKTMNLDQIHTDEGVAHMKTLSPEDQQSFSRFDRTQSLNQEIANAQAKGLDTSDLEATQKQMQEFDKTSPDTNPNVVINPGKPGIVSTVKNLLTPKEGTPEDAGGVPSDSQQIASDAIKNPLSAKEQQQAFSRGRATVDGVGNKIVYDPDKQTINMQNALKPLADDGKIVSPKTAEDQINNSSAVQEAITNKGNEIRTALENSKATWNSNELKGNLEAVNIPDPVKNEPTMIKNATSLKNAAVQLAQDAERDPSGILDLRQDFDQYVKDNYGQSFFAKGRDADPWHSYVYSLRDAMNDMAGYKLPEGSLPDGTPLREALINQSNLINAKEEMATKFVREYPEASTDVSRFLQAHPLIKRFGLRTAMTIGGTILGVSAINAGIRALESGK